ncbi:MAG: hypothetical protein H7318_08485 [Oligoflexus sp.]|nr:hypothetical protein [Oligoflexus sp.]
MKNTIFALAVLILTPNLKANTLVNNNLMTCDSGPSLQKNCHVQQGLELIPKQGIESDFHVSYKLTCDRKYKGPVPSKISIQVQDGSTTILNYKDEQVDVLIGTGYGPLTIQDALPQELAFRSFADCQLSFSSILSTPSQRVRSVWQAQLSGHQTVIDAKLALVRSLENVVILLPAYQFFGNLAANLQTDLNKNQEVIDLASKLAECKQGEECDLLYRMSSNQALAMSLEERLLVMQLRTILSEVSRNKSEILLKERMSEQSMEILNKLAADAEFYRNAQDQILSETQAIEELKSQIATLTAQLGA